MSITSTLAFLDFFESVDILLLIMVRCIGFFVLLPVVSGTNIPVPTRIALIVFTSYIVFTSGTVTGAVYDPSTLGYFYLLLTEFLVGFALAFAVYIVFMAFFLAGQIIDYQIGFAMVNILDPITQIQVPVTGNLVYLFILMMLVVNGGMNEVIRAFLQGFESLPPGAAVILTNGSLLDTSIEMVMAFFVFGVRVSLPILGTVLILDIALGVLVKAVPQMNIFVVGMPIKLLIGLVVFLLIIPVFDSVYDITFSQSYQNVRNFLEAMTP